MPATPQPELLVAGGGPAGLMLGYLLARQGLAVTMLQERLAALVPELADRVETLTDWSALHTLVVRVDRLQRWHAPGALLIGDAAHAMSPIGGVGINLAIQDAVAAARIIGARLRSPLPLSEADLNRIQRERMLPTRIIQRAQIIAQRRFVSCVLRADHSRPKLPALAQRLLRVPAVRRLPARMMGYGVFRSPLPALLPAP
ncbi:MAG: FAD-dependent monooxygenase [Pseudomonadota bacterium]